jgi:hypothetical protein
LVIGRENLIKLEKMGSWEWVWECTSDGGVHASEARLRFAFVGEMLQTAGIKIPVVL